MPKNPKNPAIRAMIRNTTAKRNMTMFEDATRAFTGKKGDAKPASAGSEMDELKAELAALQAKVDKLSR